MALSTLRFSLLKNGFSMKQTYLAATMATKIPMPDNPTTQSAHKEMQDFWDKNLALGRPNSPWMVYKPHLPMLTSLAHRATGITQGVALYGIAITTLVVPGQFPAFVDFVASLEIPKWFLFPAKTIVAFPLVYHYINGIRHLTWDAGHGYELKTQYKTGTVIVASSILVSSLLASIAYW